MQALVVSNPGRPPSLETRPEPEPGAGQVLLKVTACGLNFADLLMIEGRYQESPPVPFIPGMEVAGVVAGSLGALVVAEVLRSRDFDPDSALRRSVDTADWRNRSLLTWRGVARYRNRWTTSRPPHSRSHLERPIWH